ncbi:GreA/GreB family elongation factor, partial [Spirochaetota bacterium]
ALYAQYFIDYFTSEVKGKSPTRKILSYFILNDLAQYVDPGKLKLEPIRSTVVEFIKESKELAVISKKISSYDYKKDLVNLIEEARGDWPDIVSEILFETPVRIHKFIVNNLIRAQSYDIINDFINKLISESKQYPEIFLWVSKNLFFKTWDYDWLDYSKESITITFFRFLNELKKIETEGNRQKNIALNILFDNEEFVLKSFVEEFDESFLSKVYDLFSNLSYVEESHVEKLMALVNVKFPDFLNGKAKVVDESEIDISGFITSQEGYDKKKAEFDNMINVDMANISKELAKLSESIADPQQNAEYNALMEKQTVLEMSISKLGEEIKKAEILDPQNISVDSVNVGTKVFFKDVKTGDKTDYTILGPWDADFEKGILSYRSPIAKSLLGKKIDDEVEVKIDEVDKKFKITNIQKSEV